MTSKLKSLSQQLHGAYAKAGLSEAAKRKRTIAKFAEKNGLLYFSSLTAGPIPIDVVRGATSSPDQKDSNICIGTHDGYGFVFLERRASVSFDSHPTTSHVWHIMEFDLHSHTNLPFIFIGTRQQSRAFYARLFNTRRTIRQLEPTYYANSQTFSSHYAVFASPAEQILLAQVLSQPIVSTMEKHKLPFAIEIQDDSLFVITEATQVSQATLTQMMHYGLWLAKHLDESVTR